MEEQEMEQYCPAFMTLEFQEQIVILLRKFEKLFLPNQWRDL